MKNFKETYLRIQTFMALLKEVNNLLGKSNLKTVMRRVQNVVDLLHHFDVSESEFLKEGNVTAYLHKTNQRFRNLTVYVNDTMATTQVLSSTAQIFLPEELVAEAENATIAVCTVTSPLDFENAIDGRIIGVSVSEKNISGLKSPVIISVRVGSLASREPKCVFYNFTFFGFDDSGCSTNWSTGEDWVFCSCDHLTFFAVLMVSPKYVSKEDEEALSYITLIGCSLSLLFLVVTVLLYIIKWRGSADQSQRVHISLAVALILLNGHFIMNDLVVNVQTACIYVAVLLHYSLLATFTWTAIEGFHLYLLLLRVFNIYIRRYLLKLSLVGWGIPAIVVILIFIIDKSVYLNVGSSSENSNYNVCYISSEVVKNVTILGFFCVIFAFNLGMLVVAVRTLFFQRPVFPGQCQKRRAKDICTILGITCLLGIIWGLIFFSFGQLSTVGFYFFCILNSLQDARILDSRKFEYRMVKVVFAVMIFILLVEHSFVHVRNKDCNTARKHRCQSNKRESNDCGTTAGQDHTTTPEPKPSSTAHKSTGSGCVNSARQGCNTAQQPKPSSITHESNGPGCVNSAGQVISPENCTVPPQVSLNFTREFMRAVHGTLNTSDLNTVMRAVKNLEMALERSDFSESQSLKEGNLTAHLHKADKPSGDLSIYANDSQANTNASQVLNSLVQVTLPEELVATIQNTTVVFCMIISPKQYENVTDGRIIGVSVSGKNVSGLKSPVIISVHVGSLATRKPTCVFYNFTSSNFEGSGCSTTWSTGEDTVICSCDHLTYFAVLMVSPDNVSEKDKVVLSYISQVGCSLSLLFLVVAVILYFVKWRASADQSQQVHISLAVALILLNGHFIMNDLVVNVQTACIYVAVLLHYSLLATFTWTAIEGFHLYLLLLRVFNIYIRRYLLKLSLVGWGVPAVVVILIFIIDKSVYLNVGSSSGKSSNIQVCYISSEVVKNVTILGFFCVIFAFNLGMLVVAVRTLFFQRPVFPGQCQKRRAKDVCTILGITCLLGIIWGLIFFSFGQLSTVGLYFFCILNSLQGLFIFIWLCMSKSASSESQENMDTQTTST